MRKRVYQVVYATGVPRAYVRASSRAVTWRGRGIVSRGSGEISADETRVRTRANRSINLQKTMCTEYTVRNGLESPHGRVCTFWAKGFSSIEFLK